MYLNCKTYFSYRYGTIGTQELVDMAVARKVRSLALTNINSTADAWDFVDFCRKSGIRPVLGAEIRNGNRLLYVLLAKNDEGLMQVNRFLSEHLMEKRDFPKRPDVQEVWTIYPFGSLGPEDLGNCELIGVRREELSRLYGCHPERHPDKWVVLQPVTYQDRTRYNLHRILRAIDGNTLLSKLGSGDIAGEGEHFPTKLELWNAFGEYPEMLQNTLRVMESCSVDMELHTDKNKKYFTSSKEDDRILLEKLAMEGLALRYGRDNTPALERVKKELRIINELDFNAYFLIVLDVVRYAQHREFFYVGRGSGANSIVAYCLKITDVDPIKLDLYFERFLNPHRTSPPDFDMDFSWQDRDEVIDYIFKRYGRNHVALLGMFSTFQGRAIIRELGKVFGLPKPEIDQLVSRRKDAAPPEDRIQRAILKYGALMQDFPNYQSIHPGGMLISERPIFRYTAMERPPKGFNTAQVDMFLAEKIGLFKLDILSQRGLAHIKDAIGLIRDNRGEEVDIRQVEKFFRDPKVADQIRRADTIGCFYIESPAMRQLLTKLKCDDYLTLVAASSIIRPGVAQSGMMKQYIERFHNPGNIPYLHPKMEGLLKETYGVMVYQEDVIKVAHHFAGLDMGEADILRRAMSGKYRSHNRFKLIEEKFFANCRALGHPEHISKEVWRQMESFGGYSFSKAHSASFAVESYQSLYLKTYYPLEFMVAVINNFGGFYGTQFYFHELKKAGGKVLPPCLNTGQYLTSIAGDQVTVGFVHVQNLERKTIDHLLAERERNGEYLGLVDFMNRIQVDAEQLNVLIRVGALRFTGMDKKELLWHANFKHKRMEKVPTSAVMFEEEALDFSLPRFPKKPLEDAYDEIELIGFTLGDPFELADDDRTGVVYVHELPKLVGRQVCLLGHLVTTKPVRTVRGDYMAFGTFLDEKGDWLDTVHFPLVLKKYPFHTGGFYRIYGKVTEEFGVYAVEVRDMRGVGLRK
ncbi:DNA polymerase III subunit alpha [Echinicola strongylocentroti]|uniref:DNA-directed DNA polymerase n=1 Tax=Echinicola strongylocentroti TaxID=1795355 RepID=A0A2Z4IEE5_9BACT|nr:DNA polymerase III subunit alpha [Echinicola strongylocentroti]AWW29442.1 DNA polymerase III subunit alpha [Echinicola strongylocentroti]